VLRTGSFSAILGRRPICPAVVDRMTDSPEQPTTRRLAYEEKRQFQSEFNAAVSDGNEARFRLVLRVWKVEKGTSAWLWAWEQWDAEREAEKDAQKVLSLRRGASRRAPRP